VRALVRKTSDTSHLETTSAELVYGDIEDYDSLPPAVEGVDIVFHTANKVTPGWGKWEEFEKSTVRGTDNLVKASAEAGVSRFLYVSSCTVYGRQLCSNLPVDESTPCQLECTPDTYYEYAKLRAEEVVLDYHRQGKVDATVIRSASIYGPRDRLNTNRIYNHMARRVILWPGKPDARCAQVFASDVAECAILAATSDKARGQVYNVAPPEEISFREYGDAMIQAQGGRRIHIIIPYRVVLLVAALIEWWARLRRTKEMPYLTRSAVRIFKEGQYIDGSKARTELGWEPKVSLEEGARRYAEWRRSQ